jgi:uncharacterized protein YcsI (UPF0317 family)
MGDHYETVFYPSGFCRIYAQAYVAQHTVQPKLDDSTTLQTNPCCPIQAESIYPIPDQVGLDLPESDLEDDLVPEYSLYRDTELTKAIERFISKNPSNRHKLLQLLCKN